MKTAQDCKNFFLRKLWEVEASKISEKFYTELTKTGIADMRLKLIVGKPHSEVQKILEEAGYKFLAIQDSDYQGHVEYYEMYIP